MPSSTSSAQGAVGPAVTSGRGTFTPLPTDSTAQAVEQQFGEASEQSWRHDAMGSFCGPKSSDLHVGPNIPGSRASTINIKSMWQAWGRRIFEASTSFSNFYRAQCSKAEGRSDADPTAPVWPMPLPYGNFGRKAASLLDDGEFALRRIINLQVAKLNHLMLGEPASAPRRICGAIPLNAGQLSVVERSRRLNGAWSTQAAISAPDLGRTAAKQEQQETVLESLLEFSSNCVTGLGKYRKLIRHARLSPRTNLVARSSGVFLKLSFLEPKLLLRIASRWKGPLVLTPLLF